MNSMSHKSMYLYMKWEKNQKCENYGYIKYGLVSDGKTENGEIMFTKICINNVLVFLLRALTTFQLDDS